MKRHLGISLYPDHSHLEADLLYLNKSAQYGFTRLFISMLEINDHKEIVVKKFKHIISAAKALHFETILDVSPHIFTQLNISYDDLTFFHELGADGIRLDVGFDGKKEAMLSFNPFGQVIELNMSNDVYYLENILSHEANTPFIYGCHNFYPQVGTGLPYPFFKTCSERFKKHGIRTAAFISSQVGTTGPWDVLDGLPTLEMHRGLPVDVCAKHLFATQLIDDVIIGNAYASDAELRALSKINRYQTTFTVEFTKGASQTERNIVLNEQHVRRGDISSVMIRSVEVRKKYKDEKNIPHDHLETFEIGDIVIGNDDFGKYKNELQIVLTPHRDVRKNKVGRIKQVEHLLLDYINPWSKFTFTTTEKEDQDV